MRIRASRFFLWLATFLLALTSTAQTGIRITIFDAEMITRRGHFNILAGVDGDLTERLSVGLDLTHNFNAFKGLDGTAFSVQGSDHTLRMKIVGLQYRSIFFWSGAGYVGSTIGIRHVTFEYFQFQSYPSLSPVTMSDRALLIPIGLRFGFRSDLENWYGDLYIAAGYNVGSGKRMFDTERSTSDRPWLDTKDTFSIPYLLVGYSNGIGW